MDALQRGQAAPLNAVRVTGRLTVGAQLVVGAPASHRVLLLAFAPRVGLPYVAHVDLGTDVADHMAAEALLPNMRTGATVSVGGTHLDARRDHGHEVLVVRGARHVLLLQHPINHPDQPSPAALAAA